MYGFYGLMNGEKNVFKFVSWDALKEDKLKQSVQYKTLKRLEQGEKLNYKQDFRYLTNYDFIQSGKYRIGGWCLDFTKLLNRYVVSVKDCGWNEYYGYNKMFLRSILGSNNVLEIIQI